MVVLRAHRAAAKSAAVNDESLRQLLDVRAERSEHRRGRCEPVGFLEPEPRGIHNARLPFRRRSERAERGDKIGDGRGVDDRAVKRAAPHRNARGRFLHACSHRAENIKHGAVALRGIGAQAGNEWCGILGAALATFAVCLPSLTLMLLITRFFLRLKQNPLVEGAMKGMRPVVIGMIASAALLLMFPHSKAPDEQNFIDGWSWALFGGVFISSVKKVNPILLIALSAAAGILIYYVF